MQTQQGLTPHTTFMPSLEVESESTLNRPRSLCQEHHMPVACHHRLIPLLQQVGRFDHGIDAVRQ